MTGVIVHEWIEEHGGAERVVDAMVEAYPDADIACLWNDSRSRYLQSTVKESWLAKTPLRHKKAVSLPLMPLTWRKYDLGDYEWALVSSHLFAHHISTNQDLADIPVHVYVHTPARYIWEPSLDPRGRRFAAKSSAPLFKNIDKRAAASGALFAANSSFVRDRILRTWEQDSTVIYPPVAVSKLQQRKSWCDVLTLVDTAVLESTPREFLLGASRFVSYKNLERVIEVGEACDLPVVLAGSGPALGMLQERASRASVPVTFVHRPSDELLYALYQKAMVFVFPPIEDFGIMPVEAMALGTPVLVNVMGGAAESAALLQGGTTLPEGGPKDIQDTVRNVLMLDMSVAESRSSLLSEETFIRNLHEWTRQEA